MPRSSKRTNRFSRISKSHIQQHPLSKGKGEEDKPPTEIREQLNRKVMALWTNSAKTTTPGIADREVGLKITIMRCQMMYNSNIKGESVTADSHSNNSCNLHNNNSIKIYLRKKSEGNKRRKGSMPINWWSKLVKKTTRLVVEAVQLNNLHNKSKWINSQAITITILISTTPVFSIVDKRAVNLSNNFKVANNRITISLRVQMRMIKKRNLIRKRS